MAQKGGAGTTNADVVQTLEMKATSAQLIFDSTSASDTTLQDSATGARTLTLPDTTAGLVPDNGDVLTGVWDFGGADSLEIPNSATPTVNADGEIAIDTTVVDFSLGVMKFFGGEEQGVVSMPVAEFTSPSDGNIISYNATTDEFELIASADTQNTLDEAYDEGGAGAGRTITADTGAVAITATALGGDDLLDIDHTASGTLTANTTDVVAADSSRTHTAATTLTDDFDLVTLKRTEVTTNASSDLTANGAVLKLEHVATPTAGVLTSNVNLLEILQDNDSAGDGINITMGSSTGEAINVVSGRVDFGSASVMVLPNSATPTVDAVGEIALDTTVADFSTDVIKFFGSEEQGIVSMPIAEFTSPTDGDVVAYNATNDEFELIVNAATGNTLDQAYDQGGGGAGRTITADTGAVAITATSLGGDDLLDIDHTASGTLTANTTDVVAMDSSRTHTAATTLTDDYDVVTLKRTAVTTNASANLTSNGAVLKLENVATETAGTLADNAHLLEILQDNDGTGDGINITMGSSAGEAINIVSGRVDFGAAVLEIPNSAAPTVDADGEIAVDTSVADFSLSVIKFFGGEEQGIVSMPIAEFTSPTDTNVVTYNATNDEFELTAQSAGNNTLDEAYDQGGGGAGRTITADTGAVQINGTAVGGDDLLGVNHTASGTLTANTTTGSDFISSRTHTAATTVVDNYDAAVITRTTIANNASAVLTANGSVLKLENIATETAGTLTDNAVVLELVQDTDSTGSALSISGGALTHDHITVFTPEADQSLLTAAAIVVNNGTIFKVSGSGGAVVLTSTPNIADGTDGQIIHLVGVDDTNTLEIQSEGQLAATNLHLSGDNNFVIGLGDTITLMFNSDDAAWVELNRSDN